MSTSDTSPTLLRYLRDDEGGLKPAALLVSTVMGAVLVNSIHLYVGLVAYMGTVGPLDVASSIAGAIGGAIFGGAALLANHLYP